MTFTQETEEVTEESKELHFILVGRGGDLLLIKGSCFEGWLFPFAVLALSDDDEEWRGGVRGLGVGAWCD